jgi:outer membrane murein-binding lipoprotein Lpp
MKNIKLLLVAILITTSLTACVNKATENKVVKTSSGVAELEAKNAALELKVKRVQNTYKQMMAEKIAENKALSEENAKLKLQVKRTQNTFKGILADELKEKESLKSELGKK